MQNTIEKYMPVSLISAEAGVTAVEGRRAGEREFRPITIGYMDLNKDARRYVRGRSRGRNLYL